MDVARFPNFVASGLVPQFTGALVGAHVSMNAKATLWLWGLIGSGCGEWGM